MKIIFFKMYMWVAMVFLLMLLGMSATEAFSQSNEWVTQTYHGIRSTDPGGQSGLRNPERGFRTESRIAMIEPAKSYRHYAPWYHLRDKVGPVYSDDWWLMDVQAYQPFNITLVQMYCYLTVFRDRPISSEKIAALRQALQKLRERGYKTLIRFAYEQDMTKTIGGKPEWIEHHIQQLQPIIHEYADVIYIFQMGFVGAFGEWHSAAHIEPDDQTTLARVIKNILEMTPSQMYLQVRRPHYKKRTLEQSIFSDADTVLSSENAFTSTPVARIGFHDDAFLGGPRDGNTWRNPPYAQPGNLMFDYFTQQSAYLPVDGELLHRDKPYQQDADKARVMYDGLRVAKRMQLHHYSSFSLVHSFSWLRGEPHAVDRWMCTPLIKRQVEEAKLPLSDDYFTDALGHTVPRSQFEYIRDHLGYRLELQEASYPGILPVGETLNVQINLINRGFSTLHYPRPVNIVLIDLSGNVYTFKTDADPRSWQPFEPGNVTYEPLVHRIKLQASLSKSLAPGWYRLGLWLPDRSEKLREDPRYAIRVANRMIPFWTDAQGKYGINLIGMLEVVDP